MSRWLQVKVTGERLPQTKTPVIRYTSHSNEQWAFTFSNEIKKAKETLSVVPFFQKKIQALMSFSGDRDRVSGESPLALYQGVTMEVEVGTFQKWSG